MIDPAYTMRTSTPYHTPLPTETREHRGSEYTAHNELFARATRNTQSDDTPDQNEGTIEFAFSIDWDYNG